MSLTETSTPYTDAHIAAYPVEYIAGIDLYNAGEFHAAHDVWEERWMGEVGQQEKLFLQAMIQSAVAFHHLEIGRPGAARQMYTRAKEKFLLLADLAHPTFLPNIVCRVKLSGVVEINSRDVFDRISKDVGIGVRRLLRGGCFSHFTDHEKSTPT